MTYLQLVNDVLVRLRESEVSTVTASAYSKLIGKFVNDAKRQVENAWNWESLYTTIPITTVSGTEEYTVTGSGRRFKIISVNDDTNDAELQNVSLAYLESLGQLGTSENADPSYYAISGSDGTDAKVRFWPIPNATNTIQFNMYAPQADLSADGTSITVDPDVVVMGAYARALVERGEDGGLNSSEAYGIFKNILADLIAQESSRSVDSQVWVPN